MVLCVTGSAFLVLWRFPQLCFGRPWWLRLPAALVAFAAALSQQLPPSPEGTFEFALRPSWRSGTKVCFARRGPRPVAFVVRERRHARLARRGKHDLVCKASCSRRRALAGTARVRARDLDGTEHTVELELSEREAREAAVVTHVLPHLGLPKGDGGERGNLLVEITLFPPPAAAKGQQQQASTTSTNERDREG